MKDMFKNYCKKRLILITLLMVSVIPLISAQGLVKVTGRVFGQQKEPLIGASILERGTSNGTITDLNGEYTLQVQKDAVLVFSYIGYVSQEKKVISDVIDVILKEDNQALEEIVVVGYGVQKKSSVTGAIAQVKAEDLQNRTINNAQQALQGKTAGVQIIQTSAAPGASPAIRVRGYSSNVSSNPLYVVDGIRLPDISGIDPNDIASIEVLKDAASAAIYGAEAGNGVVLISTKKGSEGSGKITYDFQFTHQSLARIPKMLNAEQYIDYMVESTAFTQDYLLKNWNGITNTSWSDIAFGNSSMQKHNMAFAGGSRNNNYYLSLTYLDNDGIVKGNSDTYQRLTATINAEQ